MQPSCSFSPLTAHPTVRLCRPNLHARFWSLFMMIMGQPVSQSVKGRFGHKARIVLLPQEQMIIIMARTNSASMMHRISCLDSNNKSTTTIVIIILEPAIWKKFMKWNENGLLSTLCINLSHVVVEEASISGIIIIKICMSSYTCLPIAIHKLFWIKDKDERRLSERRPARDPMHPNEVE